jgi:hypothetical protein
MYLDPRFLDLGISWRCDQFHTQAALPPAEKPPRTHWIGGWVGPRVDLDDMENRKFSIQLGLELQPLSRPAHIQSLYQLHYPGTK